MVENLQQYFENLPDRLDASRLQGIERIFLFVAEGEGGGSWRLTVAGDRGTVAAGDNADGVALTLRAEAQDWLDILNGTLRVETAMLVGRLKLQGDVTLGLFLEHLLPR